MKVDDLFSARNRLNIGYAAITEAKRDRRGTQGQRGQPADPTTKGDGVGRYDPLSAMAGESGSDTGNGGADNGPNAGTVSRLGQKPDEPQSRCIIEESPSYPDSVAVIARQLGISADSIIDAVYAFRQFKAEYGNVPFSAKDKPSGTNLRGVTIRAFVDDNHWHAHLGLRPNGDPLVAYRELAANHIRIICVTTHRQNFVQRKEFIQRYASEFPKTIKRRPRLGRKR